MKNKFLLRIPLDMKVYCNNPVTVIIWDDGSKTMSRVTPTDVYDKETGVFYCVIKKFMEVKGFNCIKRTTARIMDSMKELSESDKKYVEKNIFEFFLKRELSTGLYDELQKYAKRIANR